MADTTTRYGNATCPVCGRWTALTKLGKIRQHGSSDKRAWPPRTCTGVGQTPEDKEA